MTEQHQKAPTYLWGARAIGEVIDLDEKRVFYLLERGVIPARKVGGKWVANREKVVAALEAVFA